MSKLNFKYFINEEDSEDENMVFFFKKDNEIYGAPEESRIIFARMKHPDKDDKSKNWDKDATFVAVDLKSKERQSVFGYKDLNKIKIIDREEAIKKSKASKVSANQNLDEK